MQLFASTLIAVRPVSEDTNGQEMVAFASGEARASTAIRNVSSSGSVSSASESIDTRFDAPVVHGGITRSSVGETSQNSNVLVNTNQNGISIFQGYLLSEPTYMFVFCKLIYCHIVIKIIATTL